MLEALFRNPNYPVKMEHTYSGVALEEVMTPLPRQMSGSRKPRGATLDMSPSPDHWERSLLENNSGFAL